MIDGNAAKKLMPYESADIKGYVKLDGKCYDAGVDKEKGTYPTYRELLAERAAHHLGRDARRQRD